MEVAQRGALDERGELHLGDEVFNGAALLDDDLHDEACAADDAEAVRLVEELEEVAPEGSDPLEDGRELCCVCGVAVGRAEDGGEDVDAARDDEGAGAAADVDGEDVQEELDEHVVAQEDLLVGGVCCVGVLRREGERRDHQRRDHVQHGAHEHLVGRAQAAAQEAQEAVLHAHVVRERLEGCARGQQAADGVEHACGGLAGDAEDVAQRLHHLPLRLPRLCVAHAPVRHVRVERRDQKVKVPAVPVVARAVHLLVRARLVRNRHPHTFHRHRCRCRTCLCCRTCSDQCCCSCCCCWL